MVDLDTAREIVNLLEKGLGNEAEKLLRESFAYEQADILESVQAITNDIRSAVSCVLLDPRHISSAGVSEGATVRSVLDDIHRRSENAALSTLDCLDVALPLSVEIKKQLRGLSSEWANIGSESAESDNTIKELATHTCQYLASIEAGHAVINENLEQILLIQDHHDYASQMLKRLTLTMENIEAMLAGLQSKLETRCAGIQSIKETEPLSMFGYGGHSPDTQLDGETQSIEQQDIDKLFMDLRL